MKTEPNISRREFLKVSALAGGGLVIGIYLGGCQGTPQADLNPTASATVAQKSTAAPVPTATPNPEASFEPNVYLRVDGSGTVTITVPRPEMGQGVRTALAMIVAEELDADWSAVRVEQALADSKYGNQQVGGSRSIFESYGLLRKAGATARAMLIAAAVTRWGVEAETCHTEQGTVIHQASNRQLTYADLAEMAATMPAPNKVRLKDPQDFKIIGTRVGRVDNPQIVTGGVIYASDIKLPDMLYATLVRCPVYGGEVASFDAAKAKAIEGVRHVLEISDGVAVVADNTWAAMRGRSALEIVWDEGRNATLNSAGMRQEIMDRLAPASSKQEGDDTTLRAVYEIPFLAHATQEPMTCVADVRADSCEVWAPTQSPGEAKSKARSIAKVSDEAVRLHIPLIGGGFGRRLEVDYVAQAVEISKAVGSPIKLQWTREDDIRHDYFHPCSYHLASARLDKPALPQVRSNEPGGIRTGAWRSVFNFTDAFVRESFLDEMAAALDRDPYELRLEVEPPTLKPVLKLAATKAGWGTPLPDGWGRGIGCWSTFDVTPVAQVAEVSVPEDGAVRVHRVVCAVDCGLAINPNMIEEQVEGGIVYGLTAALKACITIENGRARQSNFHDYPPLRIDEMPAIEVYIVPGDAPPSGMGEMGVPPIAPAVANAIFAATGKRVRHLPIQAEDLRDA